MLKTNDVVFAFFSFFFFIYILLLTNSKSMSISMKELSRSTTEWLIGFLTEFCGTGNNHLTFKALGFVCVHFHIRLRSVRY